MAFSTTLSLDIPINNPVNRMPFSGVLANLDQQSDSAPTGSGWKRIILTKAATNVALDTLLRMAVDFTPELDGHDPHAKIGLITGAEIKGQDLCIEGFL